MFIIMTTSTLILISMPPARTVDGVDLPGLFEHGRQHQPHGDHGERHRHHPVPIPALVQLGATDPHLRSQTLSSSCSSTTGGRESRIRLTEGRREDPAQYERRRGEGWRTTRAPAERERNAEDSAGPVVPQSFATVLPQRRRHRQLVMRWSVSDPSMGKGCLTSAPEDCQWSRGPIHKHRQGPFRVFAHVNKAPVAVMAALATPAVRA
jgi:hypothetical protein